MPRFIFTGGHDTHTLGHDFPANLPVPIPTTDAGVIAKLRGNRFFTEVTQTGLIDSLDDTLLQMLDHNVQTVTEALPAATAEELDRLEAGERGGKTRKGVMEAIRIERSRRRQSPAAAPAGGNP
ncbi:MAG: hypothetical protein OEW11_07830 [Nitrospirota bacterium]|nr:hypothetical protein [Nitrospirota bacterium]